MRTTNIIRILYSVQVFKVELCKELVVELRGDFPKVDRQEPTRSWRKVYYVLRANARASTAVSSRKSQMIKLIAARHKITAEGEGVAKEEGKQLQTTFAITNTRILGLGQMSTTIWLAG